MVIDYIKRSQIIIWLSRQKSQPTIAYLLLWGQWSDGPTLTLL
jgi:hypothetical protein